MVSHFPYFLASFTWNYGLGMTWLVVPLYGRLGFEVGPQVLRRRYVAPEPREKRIQLRV